MATDQELITQTGHDYFEGAPYREYLHLIRTGDGWKIADALWLPQ
jgi:hypothetical protein